MQNEGSRAALWLRRSILEIVLLGVCIYLATTAPNFLTLDNALTILRNVSMQGVIALAMTMVIIAGEIDLSVGSMAAFSGCFAAWFTAYLSSRGVSPTSGVVAAMLVSLTAGFAVGCASGFLRVRFLVPTFITTLAWMTVLRGAAQLITGGFAMTPFPEWFEFIGGGDISFPFSPFPDWSGFLGGEHVFRAPFPALLFVSAFVAIYILMNFTSFGRAVYAVGGNAEAARLSGIRVNQVKILVMGIVSALAALGGLMLSSQIMSGSPSAAAGWELDVISAVIIGGTSLMGGAGSVWGTLIGVIFLGVLSNGMTLMNMDEYWQPVVRGALILTAVLVNVAPGSRK
jgi:ribose/xylose/arabinose/galactoside ABC-type transport system permease subunit